MVNTFKEVRNERFLTETLENFIDLVKEKKKKRKNDERDNYLSEYKKNLSKKEEKKFDYFLKWWKPQKNWNIWVGITGSWRYINEQGVEDASKIIRYLTSREIGIINGGALGFDYITNEILLGEFDVGKKLRVILPIGRENYKIHYINSVKIGKINENNAKAISKQIEYIDTYYREILFDESPFDGQKFLAPKNDGYRKECYYFRDFLLANACDGLIPFWVNNSKGVEDTIKKVRGMEKPVFASLEYQINPEINEIITDYDKLRIQNMGKKYYKV